MGLAVAALGLSPREFRESTPHEVFAAYEVHREMSRDPEDPGAK